MLSTARRFVAPRTHRSVSARRAYPGGTARAVVQIAPAGYATGREPPNRSQTGDRDPADNPPAHVAAAKVCAAHAARLYARW